MNVFQRSKADQAKDAIQDTFQSVAQDTGADTQSNPQQAYFALLEGVPTPVWYWLGIGSIAASLILKLQKRDQDALFVGQWPPTFFILAVLFKNTPPSRDS